MKSTDAPSKQSVPFGSNGPREAITATTPSGSNQASYDQGFPLITMTLKSAGGLPPKGQDMNQILFELSSIGRYLSSGGGYVYDSSFSSTIGGYPMGAVIPNSTRNGFWVNTLEDNQTNPENTTAALTGWVPMASYGATTFSGLSSASITASTLQASKPRILLTGTLTANINLVLPAWVMQWTITNDCAGAFGVTVKTPSGSGVYVPNGSRMIVQGTGTDIAPFNSPGALVNVQSITSTQTVTKTAGVRKWKVRMVGGGGGSSSAAATGAGQVSVSNGGGAGAYAEGIYDVSGITSLLATVGIGGTGGTSSSKFGSDGGASSLGSLLSAPGGTQGQPAGPANPPFQPVANFNSNSPTGFNILGVSGAGAEPAVAVSTSYAIGSRGANGFMGAGGSVPAINTPANTAGGFGAGASGCSNGPSQAMNPGAAGRPGIIIIEEYM